MEQKEEKNIDFKMVALKIKVRETEISKKEWQNAFYRLACYIRTGFKNGNLSLDKINEKIKEIKPSD